MLRLLLEQIKFTLLHVNVRCFPLLPVCSCRRGELGPRSPPGLTPWFLSVLRKQSSVQCAAESSSQE